MAVNKKQINMKQKLLKLLFKRTIQSIIKVELNRISSDALYMANMSSKRHSESIGEMVKQLINKS